MSLAPGSRIGRYEILAPLGAGGMGEVYAAEDTRLGRRVALKFLPTALARDRQALDRFEREARAASALNHPHICTIHDIGEDDGQPFIAMELLEGQTLKARLEEAQGSGLRAQASGPRRAGIPLDEALRIAEQLADALEAAHAKGILHRDIKPANIFLTSRGTTKLLDFGIAKLAADPREAETEAPATRDAWATGEGVTLGTVGYMSPEQARTSAMHYKGMTMPLPAIARELNVRHVLEGSVRRAGNNLRITAQLIDASTDAHLWAEKYSGTNEDIFDLQEQLSRRIVEALRVVLTLAENSALAHHTFDNAAAYDCYLRAAFEASLWTADGLDRAEHYLKRGLGIIGEHPAILAGLAYVHTQRVNLGFAQDGAVAEAVSLAERALALDPSSPQAHAARGIQMMVLEGDLPGSLRHLEHAVIGAPGDVVSAMWLAWGHLVVGRRDVAAPLIERLVERDPVNPNMLLMGSILVFLDGRFDDAATLCAVPYEMAPTGSMIVYWYVVMLAYAARAEDCRAVVDRIASDPGDSACLRVALMTERALAGDRDGLDALVTPALELYARRDGQSAWNVAACYARLGDADQALAWLEHAMDRDFIPVQFLATIDPFLASLRRDPRFEALMDRARERQVALHAALA